MISIYLLLDFDPSLSVHSSSVSFILVAFHPYSLSLKKRLRWDKKIRGKEKELEKYH